MTVSSACPIWVYYDDTRPSLLIASPLCTRHFGGCVFRPKLRIEIEDVSWCDLKREMEIEKVINNGGENKELTVDKSTVAWEMVPLPHNDSAVSEEKVYLNDIQSEKPSTEAWTTQPKEEEFHVPLTANETESQEIVVGATTGKNVIVWAENPDQMEKILKEYMQNTSSKFTSWKTTKGFMKKSEYGLSRWFG